jgi:hypothetical protein
MFISGLPPIGPRLPVPPVAAVGAEPGRQQPQDCHQEHHQEDFKCHFSPLSFNGREAENVRSNIALNDHETHCIAGALNSKVAATPMFIDFVP